MDYLKVPALYEKNMSWYQEQISNCTYRQFTTGFFYGKPTQEAQIYDNNTYIKDILIWVLWERPMKKENIVSPRETSSL